MSFPQWHVWYCRCHCVVLPIYSHNFGAIPWIYGSNGLNFNVTTKVRANEISQIFYLRHTLSHENTSVAQASLIPRRTFRPKTILKCVDVINFDWQTIFGALSIYMGHKYMLNIPKKYLIFQRILNTKKWRIKMTKKMKNLSNSKKNPKNFCVVYFVQCVSF